MRKDLGMRAGKMISMGGHAVQMALNSAIQNSLDDSENKHIKEYDEGRWTKITVRVESFDELMAIYAHAEKLGLPSGVVVDAGLTEFNGVPTTTCVYIGPYDELAINKVTAHLRLL